MFNFPDCISTCSLRIPALEYWKLQYGLPYGRHDYNSAGFRTLCHHSIVISLQSLAYRFPYENIGSYSTGSRTVDTAINKCANLTLLSILVHGNKKYTLTYGIPGA